MDPLFNKIFDTYAPYYVKYTWYKTKVSPGWQGTFLRYFFDNQPQVSIKIVCSQDI